jgi:hypothetical protein
MISGDYAVYHDNQQLCRAFLKVADDVAANLTLESELKRLPLTKQLLEGPLHALAPSPAPP